MCPGAEAWKLGLSASTPFPSLPTLVLAPSCEALFSEHPSSVNLIYTPGPCGACGDIIEESHTFSVLGTVLTLEAQGWVNLYSLAVPGW